MIGALTWLVFSQPKSRRTLLVEELMSTQNSETSSAQVLKGPVYMSRNYEEYGFRWARKIG